MGNRRAALTAGQSDLSKRVKGLFAAFGERRAIELFDAADKTFDRYPQGTAVAQMLLQLHLKHTEMANDLVGAVRRMHFSSASALCRPLLEGGAMLAWTLGKTGTTEDHYARVLRVLAEPSRDLDARRQRAAKKHGAAPRKLTAPELAVVREATRLNLKRLPDLAGRMDEVDAALTEKGSKFLKSHYANFAVLSDFTHASRLGPASFQLQGSDVSITQRGGVPLLGMNALCYGLYYFCLAYQCSSLLCGRQGEARWITERYEGLQPVAKRELNRLVKK
jgi:hypothetical protein